jgi:hypothetical protein
MIKLTFSLLLIISTNNIYANLFSAQFCETPACVIQSGLCRPESSGIEQNLCHFNLGRVLRTQFDQPPLRVRKIGKTDSSSKGSACKTVLCVKRLCQQNSCTLSIGAFSKKFYNLDGSLKPSAPTNLKKISKRKKPQQSASSLAKISSSQVNKVQNLADNIVKNVDKFKRDDIPGVLQEIEGFSGNQAPQQTTLKLLLTNKVLQTTNKLIDAEVVALIQKEKLEKEKNLVQNRIDQARSARLLKSQKSLKDITSKFIETQSKLGTDSSQELNEFNLKILNLIEKIGVDQEEFNISNSNKEITTNFKTSKGEKDEKSEKTPISNFSTRTKIIQDLKDSFDLKKANNKINIQKNFKVKLILDNQKLSNDLSKLGLEKLLQEIQLAKLENKLSLNPPDGSFFPFNQDELEEDLEKLLIKKRQLISINK